MRRDFSYTLALCVLAFSSAAFADEDAISTDRPDFVDSTDVVGRKALQLEVGVGYALDDHGGQRSRTFTAPALVRYGVTPTLELRIGDDGWTEAQVGDSIGTSTQRGVADLSIGTKWHASDSSPAMHRPAIALELTAVIPSGSADERGDGVRPSVRGIAEWELDHSLSIGVMTGAKFDRSQTHRFWSGLLATSLEAGFTENLHGFAEIAGQQFAHANDGGVLASFDTGLTYLLTKSIQIDCAIFLGLNRNTPNWNLGAGFSVRM
jgi:hypothetical protein